MNENSLKKIKDFVKKSGGRVLVVEDDEPVFVISSVDEYVSSSSSFNDTSLSEVENDFIEKINQDILNWKNRQVAKELDQMKKNLSNPSDSK